MEFFEETKTCLNSVITSDHLAYTGCQKKGISFKYSKLDYTVDYTLRMK